MGPKLGVAQNLSFDLRARTLAALVPEWDNGQRYFSGIFRGGSVPHNGLTEASITIHYVRLIIPKSPRQ